MTKRMLIDDTHPEETRVVIVNGNKVEDVEFESSSRKQIKGNIYLAKVMRIEPSLQAAFVDYGGNKHGFLAFGEIHPDYYNISDTEMAEVDKEVDEIIEAKKQALKEREEQRERQRAERAERRAQYEARKAQEEAEKAAAEATQAVSGEDAATETSETPAFQPEEQSKAVPETKAETEAASAPAGEENVAETAEEEGKKPRKRRILKKRYKKKLAEEHQTETEKEGLKVLSESTGTEEESVSEEISETELADYYEKHQELFKVESPLIKGLFIKVPLTAPQLGSVRRWYRTENREAVEHLEKYSLQNAVKYEYFYDKWVPITEVMDLMPLKVPDAGEYLNKNRHVELKDTAFHYFLNVSDYRAVGEQEPYEFARSQVKDMMLNMKQVNFMKQVKEDLYQRAEKKDKIKYY